MRLEAAQPWPLKGGAALRVPLSLKPLAQPPPIPPPTGMRAGLENAGFSVVAQGAGYSGHEGGGRDGGREEVMARAVGKGSDSLSLLLLQTPLPLGTGACSASQYFLSLLVMLPPPQRPDCWVGGRRHSWACGDYTLPQKALPGHLLLGLAFGLVVLAYLESGEPGLE